MKTSLGIFVLVLLALTSMVTADDKVRVLVWDEQQPAQKQVYENFLGNEIAAYLKKQPALIVSGARHDDPDFGVAESVLDDVDVLVWWGHVRQREIPWEVGQRIVARIKQGKLSLIALHSAHWSTPFIEAMNERTISDALSALSPEDQKRAKVEATRPSRYMAPRRDDPLTPMVTRSDASEAITLKIVLPNCCFPAYKAEGKPSHVRILKSDHPIAAGLPQRFDIPRTEMYDEPFHVPAPDEVVLEERWDNGEYFRSGMVWQIGKGRVFYFRPGHETFDVYKQPETLKIIANAVSWLGELQRNAK